MDLKFSDLIKLIAEDSTAQSDKWATGISGRYHGTQQMSIVDMLKQGQMDQHPNKVKAAPGLPHSTQNMVQLLGDLYLHIDQVKHAVNIANSNPVLDERPGSKETLEEMIKKLGEAQKIVMSVGKDIDEFSINPSKKEPKKKSNKTAKDKKAHFRRLKKLE